MIEARDMLKEEGIELDLMRVKAFPFNLDVWDFIEKHDYVYVVEQNRDSQMRTLLMAEGGISAEKLRSLVWFNGQPIEANFITKKIREREPEKI
jgi:2-oxoglutarate ferredoxin oxidoreductase subunit alpha